MNRPRTFNRWAMGLLVAAGLGASTVGFFDPRTGKPRFPGTRVVTIPVGCTVEGQVYDGRIIVLMSDHSVVRGCHFRHGARIVIPAHAHDTFIADCTFIGEPETLLQRYCPRWLYPKGPSLVTVHTGRGE